MSTNNATNTANPVTVAQGGTGDSSFTPYAVLCAGTTSTGAWQNVSGVGTLGQFLQSQGAAALPQWATVTPSNNLVLLQSQSPSSVASVTFDTGISATYSTYLFLFSAVIPSTSTAQLNMQVTTSGGTISSGYTCGINTNPYNSATLTNVNSTTYVPISGPLATTSGYGLSGYMDCYNITNGSNGSFNMFVAFDGSTAGVGAMGLGGGQVASSNITGFIFSMSSGNIASGVITLFGVLE